MNTQDTETMTGPEYITIRWWVDDAENIKRTFLVAALYCFYIIMFNWNEWAVDFSAIYYAGHFLASGQWDQIFAAPRHVIGPDIPESWQAALNSHGVIDEQTYPFIYPPWVAAAMAPVAVWLDPFAAMNLVLVINAGLIVWSAVLAYRIMSPLPLQLWFWMVCVIFVMFNSLGPLLAVHLGQAQILVFFLTLLAFERLRAGRKATAGIALAFAAMIKISPLLFVFIFLWNREWRALIAFTITGALGVVLAFAGLGWDLHMTYLERLETISRHIYLIHFAYSFEALVYQVWDWWLGTAILHTDPEYYYLKPGWIAALSKAALLTSILLIWAVTRDDDSPRRVQRQLLAMSLAVPLFMPLGWAHYFMLTQFLLVGLIALAPMRVALPTIIILSLSQTKYVRSVTNAEDQFFFPDIIVSVPLLFLTLVVVIASGVRLRKAEAKPTNTAAKPTNMKFAPAE